MSNSSRLLLPCVCMVLLVCLDAPIKDARGEAPNPRLGNVTPRLPQGDEEIARQLQVGGRRCQGAYANSMAALSSSVAQFEHQPGQGFAYCLRTMATYEQVYYGRDGKLKKRYLKAKAHGTGFAYRWTGQETLLLTNHHVTTWPEVTDEDNKVAGVPPGARRVSEQLLIVRNDEDNFEPGYIPLQRVVTDPTLDASVVRVKEKLTIMPYAIGSSAALRSGNVVEVRGYPLGAFAASNTGKVTNPFVEDLDAPWDHADVALDALVNRGNSGSPVLAISCLTGEYELVGLFHAGYREGEAMNLAVGIDEVRTLMEKFTPRVRQTKPESGTLVTQEGRDALVTLLHGGPGIRQMRFGKRMVDVSLASGGDEFRFRVYGDNYPVDTFVYLQLDAPVADGDGTGLPKLTVTRALEPAWEVPQDALSGETREQIQRLVVALLTRLARMAQFREVAGEPPRSMAQHRRAERLLQDMARMEKEQEELVDGVETLLDRARQDAPVAVEVPPPANQAEPAPAPQVSPDQPQVEEIAPPAAK